MVHIILGFNPISNRFQSPKHVIKAKDPRLALIDIAIPGFLTKPSPFGTQDAQLSAPLATKLLYSHEQPLPFNEEQEEPASEPTQEDIEKDFEVFYRADSKDPPVPIHLRLIAVQVSTSQEAASVPKAMVLEEKTPDLLALLTTHTKGNASMVPIIPRPPTLAPSHTSTVDVLKKKRKRRKQTGSFEEVEIPQPTQQPPTKEPRITRVQQKKGTSIGVGKSTKGEQRYKATIWNPAFMLSTGDLVTFEGCLEG